MFKKSTLGGATALAIDTIGPLFLTALQRLYAAHVEKVQMRFAPLPIECRRGIEQRRMLGL
jgi:hypothetical protein